MTRRSFSLAGVDTALATFAEPSSAQINPPPATPSNLEQLFPSPRSGPKPCSDLPELPDTPSEAVSQKLLPGFKTQYIKTSGATICVATKGTGQPLLLLHGHPETHVTWHKIAPQLAEEYTVVLPDLRGYGDSSKPPGGHDSENYSFRAMAQDQVEVMRQLGHTRFMMAGHDRGGRVAARLCLDSPEVIEKVAVLDIAPTLTMYNDTDKVFATKYLWWFLQIQPAPMPEHLISLDPVYYLRDHLAVQNKTPGAVTPEAMAEYIRCYCCKGTIHAVCEDYRAAAGIDLDEDRKAQDSDQNIQAPMLVLWGQKGTVGLLWDVMDTWRQKCGNSVTGKPLPCGHLLQEEQPEAVLAEFRAFFRS